MSSVLQANKAVAKKVANAFGGQPNVTRFWDDRQQNAVDILKCEDRPVSNVTSYATVNLSNWPLFFQGEEYNARTEILGACRSEVAEFSNVIATAAFCVINSRWFCCPGTIFPNVVSMYKCSDALKHLFFVPPFLWEENLPTLQLDDRKVAWLLAVPISDSERELAVRESPAKLEELFVHRQIDIFDINRTPEI